MADHPVDGPGRHGPATPGNSALTDFLKHTKVYDVTKALIPKDLLQFGISGAVIVMATGLLALILPSPASIDRGEFFLVLGSTAASLDALMQGLAIPAIVSSAALLLLDVYLMVVPTTEQWRLAVVGQATVGGAGGILSVLFLALVVLNIALWIAIGCCILAGIGLFLGALASG